MSIAIDGACRCGQLTVRAAAAPLVTSACHCVGCQKMSSSAFSLTCSIPAAAFSTSGVEPVVGGLHGASKHMFCPHCLTWVFTHPEGIDFIVNVRSTMFDKAAWSVPFLEVFTAERLAWATTPAVHSYASTPPVEDYERLMAEYAAWLPAQ